MDRGVFADYFRNLTQDYVLECSPRRILSHAALYLRVCESDGSAVALERAHPDAERSRIILAAANVSATRMLLRIARRLSAAGINIQRSYVDTMRAGGGESVVIISAEVVGPDGARLDKDSVVWTSLEPDLLRLKWIASEALELGYRQPELGFGGAEILATYAELAHQLLVRTNRYVYGASRIRAIVEQSLPLSLALVRLFLLRFDPSKRAGQAELSRAEAELRQKIELTVEDDAAGTVLKTILDSICQTLKTNFFVEGRYALALRLSPELILRAGPRPEIPFGVFWIHGREFNAFHVRFRETARGGVRVVRPASDEQQLLESERQLDEAYGLAYAQQLKNKDIPEGGAKAVILVSPSAGVTSAVRAFADAMLDLITTDPGTKKRIVDHYGKEEWIYFGPDENITPEHINWIVARAKARGYPFPNALMSSKPGAGINHKEFGVTSEGLNVFLEISLNALGINPREQPFTLKITGGPDGDVAGNEIRIAIREFGANVKIVGIADGFGCAEDPEGLDHRELLRLVEQSRSIAFFDRSKLSLAGRLVRTTDPDGPRIRNEMHNRVASDAFVPAGGRPETINGANWPRFLEEDGKPKSRLIVEGANLFITSEARQKLFEAGVVIIKDSSANKGGVICSSYEIMAGLLLSEEELLAVKPRFVLEVIERLRTAARLEAEQLYEARKRSPNTPHFELGIVLSREINRLTDALAASFSKLEASDPALVEEAVRSHTPPVIAQAAQDRLMTELPAAYRAQIVCSTIASRIIYREGLDYFRDTPDGHLAGLAIEYLRTESRNQELVDEVLASALPERAEIANLLRIGGTRAGLRTAF